VDDEYIRNGVADIFKAVEPLTGKRYVTYTEKRTKLDWVSFVRELLDEKYPDAKKVALVIDNLNTNEIASLYGAFSPEEAFRLSQRLEIHFTPERAARRRGLKEKKPQPNNPETPKRASKRAENPYLDQSIGLCYSTLRQNRGVILSPVLNQAVQSVLTLFTIGLVGYLIARLRRLDQKVKDFIPDLVINVTFPLYLFYNSAEILTDKDIGPMVGEGLAGAAAMTLSFALSLWAAKILKVAPSRRGVFCTAFCFSNSMFIGLPLNMALFGETALSHVLAYFLGNSILFWTIGNYFISLDGSKRRESFLGPETLKKIFSPPIFGFGLGLGCVLLGLEVPAFLSEASRSIGEMTTPLAIFYIGVTLSDLRWREVVFSRQLGAVLLGRFLICPTITWVACLIFSVSAEGNRVFLIQSSLPVMASCSILAGYYRVDVSFASLAVSVSTVLSLLTIPIFRLLTSII
jgi:predicted permease